MEAQKNEVNQEKYLVIHTIDTLIRAYQAFSYNKKDNNADEVALKISELLKQI